MSFRQLKQERGDGGTVIIKFIVNMFFIISSDNFETLLVAMSVCVAIVLPVQILW